jgi:hypothetical protein
MHPIGRAFLLGSAFTLASASTQAQGRGGQMPVLGVVVPTGNLAEIASTGFGAALRSEFGRRPGQQWGTRYSIGIDRFNGKKPVLGVQYFDFGLDIVRHGDTFYQFGGIAFALGRASYESSVPASERRAFEGNNIGVTGGIGAQFKLGDEVTMTVESGYMNVFRDGGNDTWVPIRFGVRF